MNRAINTIYPGQKDSVGFLSVVRSLPNPITSMVGHFVFLDQLPLKHYTTEEFKTGIAALGVSAHPHRGIATVSYVLQGPVDHYDSAGHQGRVGIGGLQWMKAGTGIVHDEVIVVDDSQAEMSLNGMQFWINLPAAQKSEAPDYMAVQSENIPVISLDNERGSIRILIGDLAGTEAAVPRYADMFLFHLILKPGKTHQLEVVPSHELAAVVVNGHAIINELAVSTSELAIFSAEGSTVTITNDTDNDIDVFLFGGEPYREPVAMQGPFVMNTQVELQQALADYRSGKYGTIEQPMRK